jgi:hypothetical protein
MKNYISKLNDRNIQRNRESGITTYALISALIIDLYNIVEIYPKIPFREEFFDVILVIVYALNIYIFFAAIYSFYSISFGHYSSIRIVHKSKWDESLVEDFLQLSIILIPCLGNLFVTIYSYIYYNSIQYYFLIMTLIFTLIVVLFLIVTTEDSKLNNTYEIFEGTGRNGTDKDTPTIVIYIIGTILISFSSYYVYTIPVAISKRYIMVFCLLVYAVPFILIKIISLSKKDRYSKALENLEYEIHMSNLDDDQIKQKLQENYMGFLLLDWINLKLSNFKAFVKEVDSLFTNIENDKKELKEIDSIKYPIECEGRKEKIKNVEIELKDKINNYFNTNFKEIQEIWEDKKLDSNERLELHSFWSKLNDEFTKYKKKYEIT